MAEMDHLSGIEDAPPPNWIIRRAPAQLRPWLELVRADRPVGIWLLLLPCWQGLMLAAGVEGWKADGFWLLAAFAIGAIAMRGAGCALNDLIDRDFDRSVRRTRGRPVATGRITRRGAAFCSLGLSLIGLAMLLTMNLPAIALGLAAILPAALYPFAKRFTHWPQLILGIAFNWGALLGWVALVGYLYWPPVWLYLGGIFWTLGYDTIYAAMDREDDRTAGVKSLAVLFEERTPRAIAVFYSLSVLCLAAAGWAAETGVGFWIGLVAWAAHLAWQVRTLEIDNRKQCLRIFRSNRDAGLVLLAAILLGGMFPGPPAG